MVICTILSNFGQTNRNFSYIRRVTGIIKRIGIRDMWLKDKLFGNKKKQEENNKWNRISICQETGGSNRKKKLNNLACKIEAQRQAGCYGYGLHGYA